MLARIWPRPAAQQPADLVFNYRNTDLVLLLGCGQKVAVQVSHEVLVVATVPSGGRQRAERYRAGWLDLLLPVLLPPLHYLESAHNKALPGAVATAIGLLH